MKVEEIHALSVEEILERVEKLKKEMMQNRFQAKTGKLERQSTIREKRRDVARLLTIMNQKTAEGAVLPVRQAAASGGKKEGKK